jgi:hypothetical protein
MALRVPPFAEAFGIVQALEALGKGDGLLLPAFAGVIRVLPEADYRELQTLCRPVPEVRRVIAEGFAGELQAAVDQLQATQGDPEP